MSLDQLRLQVDRPRNPKLRSRMGGARTDLPEPSLGGKEGWEAGSLKERGDQVAVRKVGREAHQRLAEGFTEHSRLGR